MSARIGQTVLYIMVIDTFVKKQNSQCSAE